MSVSLSQDRFRGRRRTTRVGLPRPTPLAWGLALMGLAILGAAFNTGNNLLYLLFSFLAATLPLSLVGSLLNLVRMDLRLTLPAAPQAGQPFPVRIELQSRRRRPARSLRITLFSEAGPLSEAVLERLMPGRTVQLVLPVRLVCRGPLMVKGVRLSSTFPLGLLERRRFFHREGEILVLPPPASRPARPAVANRSGGTVQSERVSGEEYQGLRQGRPEEDIRRVDWKSTARRGDLMVRETSGEAPPWKSFNLITRRDGEPAAAREAFERELAGLCGQATSILLSGGSVLLSVDGVGERIYQGPEGLASCRRRLARLEPTDSRGSLLPRLRPVPVGRPRAATESRRLPAGAAHAVSVRAALLISILALLSTGALGRVVSLALLGAVAAALFRWSLSSDSAAAADGPPGHNSKSLILWRLAGFLALAAYSTDLLFIRHNPLRASLDLIAFITVYKLFNAGGLRDDRQILLVSLLQMILTSALTTQVAFLLPLLAWILVASHAQVAWSCLARRQADTVFRWMEDESRRWLRYPGPALALTLMMTAVAGLLFVLVPHLGTGTFAPGVLSAASRSGFSMTTRLGEIGRIKQDRSRVMEIQVAGRVPPKEEIRWRGLALSHFDGHVWSGVRDGEMRWLPADGRGRFFPATGSTAMATDAAGQGASGLKAKGGDEGARRHGSRGTDAGFLQRIRLEPHEGRVLFAAATPERIQSADFVFLAQDFSGALLLPGDAGRRVSYTVLSKPLQASPDLLRLAVGPDPPVVRKIDLQLPRLDPRLVDLSRRLTEGEPTRFDAVVAIRDWLSQNLIYSLNVQDEGRENPVAAFLFDGMAAHCEYFASSMVLLARAAGIPARFVAGYQRGEQNRISRSYTVRQSDAHAWVEVYFPGVGWIPFDPTPEAGQGHWQEQGLLRLAAHLYSSAARLWDDYVIGIDLLDQATLFEALRESLVVKMMSVRERFKASSLPAGPWSLSSAIIGLLGLVCMAAVWRRRRLSRLPGADAVPSSPPAFYVRFLFLLRRAGLVRGRGETPLEFSGRAAACLPAPAGRRIREITQLYYLIRFDPAAGLEKESRRLAGLLLRDLRSCLRR